MGTETRWIEKSWSIDWSSDTSCFSHAIQPICLRMKERKKVGFVSSYRSPESLETTETLPSSGGYLQSPPSQTYTPLGGMESPLSLYRTSKLHPHSSPAANDALKSTKKSSPFEKEFFFSIENEHLCPFSLLVERGSNQATSLWMSGHLPSLTNTY